MTKSFNCASCSAPLEFEGKMMQKCGFCGSTVIVPSDMFYGSRVGDFADISSLTGKAHKIGEIQQLLHNGQKIKAIKLFRETFGVGLEEAKNAVEKMERGEGVDISGMQIRSSGMPIIKLSRKWIFAVVGVILIIIIASAFIPLVIGLIAAFSVIPGLGGSNASSPTPVPKQEIAKTHDAIELMKIGGEGTGAGKFKDNRHVAVDGSGRIYSGDYSGGRIQVLDADGKFLTQWTAEAGMNLYDMVADRKGSIYIANNKGLFAFDGVTGKILYKAEKVYPRGLTLTLDGRIVAATGQDFLILDSALKPLQEFKDTAKSADVTSGFERLAIDGNGFIFALDRNKGDICKFSPDGKFLDRFSSHAHLPHYIALDPKGRIFVVETNSIKVVDENGRLIKSLDATQAFGLAFNDEGELFVASRPYVLKYRLNF